MPQLGITIDKSSTVVTDNFAVYRQLGDYFEKHSVVSHNTGQYVNEEGFDTNGIERFLESLQKVYHWNIPPRKP